MTSFVAVGMISPGVQAESCNGPCAWQPDVLVRTPHRCAVAVVVVTVAVPVGTVTETSQLLKMMASATITISVETYLLMACSSHGKSRTLIKAVQATDSLFRLQYQPRFVKTAGLHTRGCHPVIDQAVVSPAHAQAIIGIDLQEQLPV